jgi:hypothetical protein
MYGLNIKGITAFLLAAPGGFAWRLLSHEDDTYDGGGTFIIGTGSSSCFLVDKTSHGVIIQSANGDNPRISLWIEEDYPGTP